MPLNRYWSWRRCRSALFRYAVSLLGRIGFIGRLNLRNLVVGSLMVGLLFTASPAHAASRTLHVLRSPSFANPLVLQSAALIKAQEALGSVYCAVTAIFGFPCGGRPMAVTSPTQRSPQPNVTWIATSPKPATLLAPSPEPAAVEGITIASKPAPRVAGAETEVDQNQPWYTPLSLFYAQTRSNFEDLNHEINDTAGDLSDGIDALEDSINAAVDTGALTVAGNATVTGSVTFAALGSGVLVTDATGAIATSTLSGAHITADTLNFTELSDNLALDASTVIDLSGHTLSLANGTTTATRLTVDTLAGATATLASTTITDVLAVPGRLGSDIIPSQNAAFDLGSPAFFYDRAYIKALTVNSLAAASSSVSGSAANTFTFNADNATADTEDIDLIFFRGAASPNALITWDSVDDRFETNQSWSLQSATLPSVPTLSLGAAAGQATNILQLQDESDTTVFAINPSGAVTAGVWNGTAIDISDYTNLQGNSEIVLTNDALSLAPALTRDTELNTEAALETFITDIANVLTDNDTTDDLIEGSTHLFSQWDTAGSDISYTLGNVGVGTTTPNGKLTVLQGAAGEAAFNAWGNHGYEFFDVYEVGGGDQGKLALRASGIDTVFLDTEGHSYFNGGNVGIGTTTPSTRLQVWESGATGPVFSNTVLGSFVRSAGNAEVSITSNASSIASLYLGDAAAADRGRISYDNATDSLSLFTATAQRLTIDSSGSVGIGTTAPGAPLDIEQGSQNADILRLGDNDSTSYWGLSFGEPAGSANSSLSFNYNGTAGNFVLSSIGHVGIGTTTPGALLDFSSAVAADKIHFGYTDTGIGLSADKGLVIWGSSDATTNGSIIFKRDSRVTTPDLTIASTGNVGIGTTNPNEGKLEVKGGSVCVDTNSDDNASSCIASESDERLKKNVETLSATSTRDVLRALNPVSFDWRVNDPDVLEHYPLIARFASSTHSVGLIAQEVEPLLPEAIGLETVGDDEVQYLQLDYSKFVPLLIKGWQELDARVTALSEKFVDGILTVTEARIEYVRSAYIEANTVRSTDELCIGKTCLTEDEVRELRSLLGNEGGETQPGFTPEPGPAPEPVPPVEPATTDPLQEATTTEPLVGSEHDDGQDESDRLDPDVNTASGNDLGTALAKDDLDSDASNDNPQDVSPGDDLIVPPPVEIVAPAPAAQ